MTNLAGKMNKTLMTEAVTSSEDVKFQWWLLWEDFEEEIGDKLLCAIVDFYVQIRGFPLLLLSWRDTNSSKKSLQIKSKPLRTELSSINSTVEQ